jgi:cysteine-rich repeat protein
MQERAGRSIFVSVIFAVLFISVFAVSVSAASDSGDGGFWGWLKSFFTGKGVTGNVIGNPCSTSADCDTGAGEYCDTGGTWVCVGGGYGGPVCGNGAVETGEQCDDNNLVDGDCCSSTCQIESAGSQTCGAGPCSVTTTKCNVDGTPTTCVPGTPTAETCNGIDDDCNGVVDYSELVRQFGSSAMDYGYRVSADGSGNIYAVGRVGAALPGQTHLGNEDAYVRKYDSSGTVVWTREFGTSSYDMANDVSADSSGNIYVGGDTYGTLPGQTASGSMDAFVRKYDSTGTVVWTNQFGTSSEDYVQGVSVDSSGNVYAVGFAGFNLSGQTYLGSGDAFVRKYDSSGNILWTRQFGTSGYDVANDVSVDSSGNVYVAGFTAGTFPGQTNSGGQYDAFVVKYDSSGTLVWARQFGTSSGDIASGVSADSSGNAYVAGHTNGALPGQTNLGNSDAFVRKYDGSGTELWTRQYGTPGFYSYDNAMGVSVDGSGNAYVAGYTTGNFMGQTSSGGTDAYVRKYDSSGTEVWTKQFGTFADDSAYGISVDSSTNIYVAGTTTGTFSGQTNSGGQDVFILKLSNLGCQVCGDGVVGSGEQCDGTNLGVIVSPIISSFYAHTCASLSDGTIKCWGRGFWGQLGNGANSDSGIPVSVSGITSAVQTSAGHDHTCAVLSDGTAKCWGYNANGQLGDGTGTNRLTPVSVSGITNAVQISAGTYHSCALLSDGTIKCWGNNGLGALGDGTTTNRNTPVSVSGISNAVQVSAGSHYTCALLSDGTIKCWGIGTSGQLGDGTGTNRLTPVSVSGITNAVQVSASNGAHTCAVLSDGTAKCWGENSWGQLGDGTTYSHYAPVSVSGINNAMQISTGWPATCAVLSDGTAKCWGMNNAGMLGDGTTTDRSTPVSVLGITNAVQVAAGQAHVCAVLSDGTAKCWGGNGVGQLGDGTGADSYTPVSVLNYQHTLPLGEAPTCQSLGFTGGTLACSNCAFDTSGCYNQQCGNSIVETGEQCDDGAAQTPASCGIGACQRTVADTCINSGLPSQCTSVACVPGTPVAEICNNIDDDCDGNIDEGNVCCGNGVVNPGEQCDVDNTNVGNNRCIDASGFTCDTSCVKHNVTGTVETTRDTIDNDCDGKTDEVTVKATTSTGTPISGVGVYYPPARNCGNATLFAGNTNADGVVEIAGLTGSYCFSAIYKAGGSNKVQDVTQNLVVTIPTMRVTVNVTTCAGAPVSGANVWSSSVGSCGQNEFIGTTPSSGIVIGERYSGAYCFRAQKGDISTKTQNISVDPNVRLTLPMTCQTCGNNIREGTEVCDGNSQACAVGGYAGTQTCNAQCTGWDACSATESCGDGIINDAETCDDGAAQTPASCGVGACARTVADTCVNCANVACTPGAPGVETCNNIDDDCNGVVDDGLTQACYDGPAGTQNVGACHGGTQTCAAGAWGACVGEVTPVGEICGNGIDDDCNGAENNGCGGVCDTDGDGYMQSNLPWCIIFGPLDDCDDDNPNVHPGATEIRDGADNDCDGLTDEVTVKIIDSTGAPLSGARADYGSPNGGFSFFGTTGADGTTQKVLPGTSYWFYPSYASTSGPAVQYNLATNLYIQFQTSKTTVEIKSCGGTPTSGLRIDYGSPNGGWNYYGTTGVDGKVSRELFPVSTYLMLYSTPHEITQHDFRVSLTALLTSPLTCCVDGDGDGYKVGNSGCGTIDCNDNNPNVHPGATEVCNGIDDDCNAGTADGSGESWFGDSTVCGDGVCESSGQLVCTGGQQDDTCTPGTPGTEVCEGSLDEDCDGIIDNGCNCINGKTRVCGSNIGECRQGLDTCVNGNWNNICVGEVTPATEVCDGLDNDCDSVVDGVFGTTTCGQGVCLHTIENCLNGQTQTCDPLEGASTEVCEGSLDEDCDGVVDDGCACTNGQTRDCGSDVGECVKGLQTCVNGQWAAECVGEVTPSAEICDGLDNDCDGVADNGFVSDEIGAVFPLDLVDKLDKKIDNWGVEKKKIYFNNVETVSNRMLYGTTFSPELIKFKYDAKKIELASENDLSAYMDVLMNSCYPGYTKTTSSSGSKDYYKVDKTKVGELKSPTDPTNTAEKDIEVEGQLSSGSSGAATYLGQLDTLLDGYQYDARAKLDITRDLTGLKNIKYNWSEGFNPTQLAKWNQLVAKVYADIASGERVTITISYEAKSPYWKAKADVNDCITQDSALVEGDTISLSTDAISAVFPLELMKKLEKKIDKWGYEKKKVEFLNAGDVANRLYSTLTGSYMDVTKLKFSDKYNDYKKGSREDTDDKDDYYKLEFESIENPTAFVEAQLATCFPGYAKTTRTSGVDYYVSSASGSKKIGKIRIPASSAAVKAVEWEGAVSSTSQGYINTISGLLTATYPSAVKMVLEVKRDSTGRVFIYKEEVKGASSKMLTSWTALKAKIISDLALETTEQKVTVEISYEPPKKRWKVKLNPNDCMVNALSLEEGSQNICILG